MGLYYNPQPPHIGAAQPLEPRKLLPQSPPQDPPFVGPRRHRQEEVMSHWAAAVVAAATVFIPSTFVTPSAPSSTPVGSRIPAAVLVSWDIKPHAAISARNPPPAGPIADNPPSSGQLEPVWTDDPGIPDAILNRALLVSAGAAPSNPPFTGGARVPYEVLVWWVPPAPQPPVAGKLTPPTAAAPSGPPVGGGALVPQPVLVSWLLPAPAPIVVRNLVPPISAELPTPVGRVIPAPVLAWWAAPPFVLPQTSPNFTASGPATMPFLRGTQVSLEVLVSWEPPARQLQTRQLLPPVSAPSFPFPASAIPQGTIQWWSIEPPAPYLARYKPPLSAPAPDNPPLVLPARFWQTVYGAALDWFAAQNYQTLVRVSFTPSGPSVQPAIVEPPGGGKRKKKPVRPIWDRGPKSAPPEVHEPAPVAKADAPVQKAKAPQGPADKVSDQLAPTPPAPLQRQDSKSSQFKLVLARSLLAEADDVATSSATVEWPTCTADGRCTEEADAVSAFVGVTVSAVLHVVEDDDRVLAEANQLPWRLAAATLREDADEIFASAFEDDDEEAMRLLLDGDGDILAFIHREDKDSIE